MIEKSLTISTGHVSKATADLLDSGADMPFRYEKHEYGWILFVTDPDEPERYEDYPELLRIMRLANHKKCSLVNLDADADHTKLLEKFNW